MLDIDETLIDSIYEAGAAPDRWPSLLQAIGRRFGALGGLIYSVTPDAVKFMGSPIVAEVMDEFVAGGWMAHNDRAHQSFQRAYPGFLCDTDFHSEQEMLHMPMYRDFLVPRRMVAAAGTAIKGAADDQIIVSLEGFPDHGTCGAAVPALDALRPHFARAAVFSSQLKLQRANAMAAALQVMGASAAVLDTAGRLRASNALFDRHLGAAFMDMRARLRMTDPRADRQLETALAQIRAGLGGRSFALPAPRDGAACVIHVLPVRGSARDVFADTSVILIMAGSRPGASVGIDILQSLFDLTAAEAKVAKAIGEGRSLPSIAEAQGLSLHTVRNQLKSVFQKTGVDRQTDLLMLVSSLAPPPINRLSDESEIPR